MPLISDVLNQLGTSQWFSSLDLQSGFWQIAMHEPDIPETAVITKRGLYEWTVMPFGLKNATATFQWIINKILEEDLNDMVKVFVDDVNIHSADWLDHLKHVAKVLKKLCGANLRLNPDKCSFGYIELIFLGHKVSRGGCTPSPSKIEAIMRFPIPKNVTNVRSFLGITGYYRIYIRDYAIIAAPLFQLTKRNEEFRWDGVQHNAFEALRLCLASAPILIRPDFNEPFILDIDWSQRGVGAILSQKKGRREHPVAYASRGLTTVQRKFHPMEGECYALVWGVMHYRQYLYRNQFTIRTDHRPLEWLASV